MIENLVRIISIKKLKDPKEEINDLIEFPSENPNPVFRVSTDYRIIYANKPAKELLAVLGLKGIKIPKKILYAVKASQKKKNDNVTTSELKIGISFYALTIIKIENKGYYNIYGYDITDIKKSEKYERKTEEDKLLLKERNYIARELHDTVTQTLFSSNLISEVLPKLWKKDPRSVMRRLKEIRMLNNLALTEIRALLYDLRPSSFKNEDLGQHLKDLVKTIGIRTKIPISVEVRRKYKYSHRIEVSFYRIAQEALNNIVKHSSANKAKLVLKSLPSKITLVICDDGKGFNTEDQYPESLGVIIMKERAKIIGASFEIKSSPGNGTMILLAYHNTKNSDNNYE